MSNLTRYYRLLDLEPGASLEEIHQSYKDLALVWHPDRFLGNPRLLEKAHSKIQQLNEAYQHLRVLIPKQPAVCTASAKVSHAHDHYHAPVSQARTADYQQALYNYIQSHQPKHRDSSGWLD